MSDWEKTSPGMIPPKLAATPSSMVPGGFWRRFVATVVDQFILGIVMMPLILVLFFSLGVTSALQSNDLANSANLTAIILYYVGTIVISFVGSFFYFGYFYSKKGASPGKMLMGLRVVDANSGANVTMVKAFLRETVGKMISGFTLMIGFIMAGLRNDKKALHDLMMNTQVLHKK